MRSFGCEDGNEGVGCETPSFSREILYVARESMMDKLKGKKRGSVDHNASRRWQCREWQCKALLVKELFKVRRRDAGKSATQLAEGRRI